MKQLWSTGTTKRYHTVAGLGQDVAAHSWGVAMIILKFNPSPSLNLIKAALYHDCAEKFVGDAPAVAKWNNPALKEAMDDAEAKWDKTLGTGVSLTEFDRVWLKAADMLELVLFCDHALMLGNQYAREIRTRGLVYLHDMQPLPVEIKEFIDGQQWN